MDFGCHSTSAAPLPVNVTPEPLVVVFLTVE
jgi:hypothetical protein